MAWTGVATQKLLEKYTSRITGLSLAANTTATIGLPGDAGADLQLAAPFPTALDARAVSNGLALADVVELQAQAAASPTNGPLDLTVTKGGNPFRITVKNNDVVDPTVALELTVKYRHSGTW